MKEYFEQNNLEENNYGRAMFIKFLMEKKTKGKEIAELAGIKHSQITSYKKIINSGKIEELKNNSVSKVFKSIEKSLKLDKGIITGIEELNLGDRIENDDDDLSSLCSERSSEEEEKASSTRHEMTWEEEMERLSAEFSNDFSNELELWVGDLESQNRELHREIKKLNKKIAQDDQQKTIEEQKKTIEEQKKTIEELRKENSSLLAFKKFFEEMKDKVEKFSQ